MASVSIDRLRGTRNSLAFKAPCVVATTANITLSGTQTIDGVAVVAEDRVLVKDQTTASENGIYVADSGTWQRAADFEGANNAVTGTIVRVNSGSTNSGFWYVSTTGEIAIGTTSIAFTQVLSVLATVSAYMQTVAAASDATTAFGLLAAAGIAFTGDISPTALAANTDDWAPTGFSTASTIRLDASAAYNLTGIAAGTEGRMIMLHNISAYTITLKDNVTSTAANRFQLNGDYSLAADCSVVLEYDSTSSRWRVFGQQSPASSATDKQNRELLNAGLAVTMAANAVTIALKGADGNDPSASNTVKIGFRSATLTSGAVNERSITAALSTVISSGSTGGTVSAQASRIWIAAIDNAGTVELAWYQSLSGTAVVGFDESGVITTTAEGGAGAADSAQTWYSTTARSSVPFTILGYFDSTQTTAGTWATSASVIMVNPSKRPGSVINCSATQTGAVATGTTVMPWDDTIPQITEGDQYMSLAITPKSAANLLKIDVVFNYANSAADGVMGLFQDTTANALAAATQTTDNGARQYQIVLTHYMTAGTASATTFRVRAGPASAATMTFNGAAGARKLGGVMASSVTITEINA
ncbi:MAG: hypothetical protein ACYC36_03805 [Bellilinea sp.]